MSIDAFMMRLTVSGIDRKRDKAIPLPAGVTEYRNLSYGPHGKWNRLDVYYPEGAKESLPTIVSIHGGGYVYGTKEIYRRYGMDMARRGFAFVNFNYRLAPERKFPAPLEDTNAVMQWIIANAEQYHLDPERIILLGDSAGAQLTSHYAAIATNKDFAAHFNFTVPRIRIRAVGLFCGVYDTAHMVAPPRKGMALDYLGKKIRTDDPRLQVLDAITGQFPPAFIATSFHDFLRPAAEPMYDFLTGKGIEAQCQCYGSEDRAQAGHVFHVNILLPEAVACNDDAAAFFRKYL